MRNVRGEEDPIERKLAKKNGYVEKRNINYEDGPPSKVAVRIEYHGDSDDYNDETN